MTKKIVIILLLVVSTTVVAWFLWEKFGKNEKFATDGIADLGQSCESKSCCNGTCIKVGDSKKCMYVLGLDECGCNDPDAVCMAGAKCKNNVCLKKKQIANSRVANMSMKQCKKRFFPKNKKTCDNIINEKIVPLPERIDYSKGTTRYDNAEK